MKGLARLPSWRLPLTVPPRPRRLARDLAALLSRDTLPAGLAALQSALPAEGYRVRVLLSGHGRHSTVQERSCTWLDYARALLNYLLSGSPT